MNSTILLLPNMMYAGRKTKLDHQIYSCILFKSTLSPTNKSAPTRGGRTSLSKLHQIPPNLSSVATREE